MVCATPIGNLGDVSERLRETLLAADIVYAEDTRRTGKLLTHIGASVPTRSLFMGNEAGRTEHVIADLREGKTVVLVSDAGMPTISDPGARVVARAHAEGLAVSAVPGPSAVTTAVTLAGFGADRFVFEGFLPRRGLQREQRIAAVEAEHRPVVLFASPNRLPADLADLRAALGDTRRVAVARELTKLHEEVWVGSLADAVDVWSESTRGEVTLVIEPGDREDDGLSDAFAMARGLIEDGDSLSEAARAASTVTGVSRRRIYQELLADQG